MINNVINTLQSFVHWLWGLGPIKFGVSFVLGTFVLAGALLYLFSDLIDLGFKMDFFSDSEVRNTYINFYIIFFVISVFFIALFITSFGSNVLRYFDIRDRVGDLKTSKLVKKTKNSMDLMGLSLKPFASEEWFNTFEEKLCEGLRIRLLVVDPTTVYALNRPSSINNGTLSQDIECSIQQFSAFSDRCKSKFGNANTKFELRKYKANASMSLFILDDEIRLGLLLEGETGLTAPEIRLHNHGKQIELFKKVQKHYDDVWDKSTQII